MFNVMLYSLINISVKHENENRADLYVKDSVCNNTKLLTGYDLGLDIMATGIYYFIVCYNHVLVFIAYSSYIVGCSILIK